MGPLIMTNTILLSQCYRLMCLHSDNEKNCLDLQEETGEGSILCVGLFDLCILQ